MSVNHQHRILVVDDERNIRVVLRTALETAGYVVEEAPDGAAALKRLEAGGIDLVVLDLNMPVLDGMSVLQRLTDQDLHTSRIIVLTAHGSVSEAVKAVRLGASDFLQKPVLPADFLLSVASVLGETMPPNAHLFKLETYGEPKEEFASDDENDLPKESRDPSGSLHQSRVLIVDDEANIRVVVRTALETVGYAVEEAADGAAALHRLQARGVDVMLLDLNMPVLNGQTVLETLLMYPLNPSPRVVVMTAFGTLSAALSAMRLGAVDFLEKPTTPDLLRETIAAALEFREESAGPLARLRDGTSVPLNCQFDSKVLSAANRALKSGDADHAEKLLMTFVDEHKAFSARFLNALGGVYESKENQRLARKCYLRALLVDAGFEPAAVNLRRLNSWFSGGGKRRAG